MSSSALRSSVMLAAVGAAVAASAAFGAPTAFADQTIDCQPGQIVIDGQCVAPPPPTATDHSSDDNGHH